MAKVTEEQIPLYEDFEYEDAHNVHLAMDSTTGSINQEGYSDYINNSKKLNYTGVHSVGFKDFLLKPFLQRSIVDCGFEHPSEVQQECIPQAMIGVDILCQAKSGMGKTAVFVLTTLHQLPDIPKPLSVLVMCHTRELAFQIKKEYDRFSKHKPEITCEVMYGGQPLNDHIKVLKKSPPCILVGTPGRLLALAKNKNLDLSNLKHFVLDECDKMLQELDMRQDVQTIFKFTPHEKQVMMFSATLSQEVRVICKKFMKNPFEIFIDNQVSLTLHGLHQYYVKLNEDQKNKRLIDLLDSLHFNQVIVFVKTVKRADALNRLLANLNFPSITIHSSMKQKDRIDCYQGFKEFKSRVMVATDILGRGIDVERVNVVFNYDMPDTSDQYLHRVGRAGRFGTKGLTISFVSSPEDSVVLAETQKRFEVKMQELPETIDSSTYMNN